MASPQPTIEEVVRLFNSENNELRKQAEAIFAELKSRDPSYAVMALASLLAQTQHPDVHNLDTLLSG